jgi:phage-related protein
LHKVSLSSTSLPLGRHHPEVTQRRLTKTYKNLYIKVEKPVAWLGSALPALRAFPADARRDAGFELRRVQEGLDPNDWKPMPSIGPGVREIRIHTGLEHRVFYIATFAEAVYFLHAFENGTRKTPKHDLELAHDRLRALVNRRRTDAGKK